MATKEPERADDGKFHHGCGETFQHAAWYTKHAFHCDGKPVQKRGRIERLAARAGNAIAPTRTIVVARPARQERQPALPPASPTLSVAAVATAATDTAIDLTIAGLHARRTQIDVAISALEALRA